MTQTMLERAARAARVEIDRLRKTRIQPKQGLWEHRDGLGWENLDPVSLATARAVLMAVREPSEAMSQAARTTEVWEDMIDFVLSETAQPTPQTRV